MSEKTITLGGGCFWCTEAVYVRMKGNTDVESGYANGHIEHPSYEQGTNLLVAGVLDVTIGMPDSTSVMPFMRT